MTKTNRIKEISINNIQVINVDFSDTQEKNILAAELPEIIRKFRDLNNDKLFFVDTTNVDFSVPMIDLGMKIAAAFKYSSPKAVAHFSDKEEIFKYIQNLTLPGNYKRRFFTDRDEAINWLVSIGQS